MGGLKSIKLKGQCHFQGQVKVKCQGQVKVTRTPKHLRRGDNDLLIILLVNNNLVLLTSVTFLGYWDIGILGFWTLEQYGLKRFLWV